LIEYKSSYFFSDIYVDRW